MSLIKKLALLFPLITLGCINSLSHKEYHFNGMIGEKHFRFYETNFARENYLEVTLPCGGRVIFIDSVGDDLIVDFLRLDVKEGIYDYSRFSDKPWEREGFGKVHACQSQIPKGFGYWHQKKPISMVVEKARLRCDDLRNFFYLCAQVLASMAKGREEPRGSNVEKIDGCKATSCSR